MPFSESEPKIVGHVNDLVASSMCPWLVAAAANARLGSVSVGAELNHRSHTANPRARPDKTGSMSGVKVPMMSAATVPGRIERPSFSSHPSVYAKSLTNPLLVAAGGLGGVSVPKSWLL